MITTYLIFTCPNCGNSREVKDPHPMFNAAQSCERCQQFFNVSYRHESPIDHLLPPGRYSREVEERR